MKTRFVAALAAIALFYVPTCFAQGQQITAGPFPVSGLLYVCPVPSGGTPCPSPVAIFSNAGLTTGLSNPIVVFAQQTYTFFAASGQYTLEMPAAGYQAVVGGGSSGGASSATGVYLSPNCSVGSVTLPCINIPASGGCYGATNGTSTVSVSNGSPTVTFSSGFPNPLPVVGEIAWVGLERAGHATSSPTDLCGTLATFNQLVSDSWSEAVYCGKRFSAGGTPVTITAVDSVGGTVTLSQNCVAPGSTSAVFFYMPNIYSQLQTACLGPNGNGSPPQSIHIAAGIYGLDNTGSGAQSACGCIQSSGCTPNTYSFGHLIGEGEFITELYTPPWYDHEGDLGTVLSGGILENITLDGTWTLVTATIGRGTPYDGSACGSHDFAIVGYNFGVGDNAETIYPPQGSSGASCPFTNFLIQTGNRGITTGAPQLINGTILSAAVPILAEGNGTTNSMVFVDGGFYGSGGIVSNSSSTLGAVINHEAGLSPSGDTYAISNAVLCNAGAANAAIIDSEAAGEVRIGNTRINNSPACTPGTNVGGISVASGINLRVAQTAIKANGTGNTITYPSGANLFIDNESIAELTGGAGLSSGGTAHHSESGTCTFAASTTCAVTFAVPFGSTPGFFIPPNITATATTLTVSALSATGATITASTSNSAAVAWTATLQ